MEEADLRQGFAGQGLRLLHGEVIGSSLCPAQLPVRGGPEAAVHPAQLVPPGLLLRRARDQRVRLQRGGQAAR
jgi:hypothetical protein